MPVHQVYVSDAINRHIVKICEELDIKEKDFLQEAIGNYVTVKKKELGIK